jgi:hypothetical protein
VEAHGLQRSPNSPASTAAVQQTEEGDTLVAYIRRAVPQIRTDRRKVGSSLRLWS